MIKAVMERISMKLRKILLPLFQFASCVLGSLTDTSFNDSINDLSREDLFLEVCFIFGYIFKSFISFNIWLNTSRWGQFWLHILTHSLRDANVKYIGRDPGCNVCGDRNGQTLTEAHFTSSVSQNFYYHSHTSSFKLHSGHADSHSFKLKWQVFKSKTYC